MQIYQIDLHYHAGQERGDGKTLWDYVNFAYKTGRKVLGVTDHIGLYGPPKRDKAQHYPQNINGLTQFRKELDELRSDFPEMQLFFAPELSPYTEYESMDTKITAMSDFFICEPFINNEGFTENTQNMLYQLIRVHNIERHTGLPAFIAHPFRELMSKRLLKGEPSPFEPPEEYSGPDSISDKQVDEFFGFDLGAFGEKSAELDISIEINGETLSRASSYNNPLYHDLLCHAYSVLIRRGATFVPSSDLHGFSPGRVGTPVPSNFFQKLGLITADITFLQKISVDTILL